MPMKYDSQCQTCGTVYEYVCTVAQCLTSMPNCCGNQTKKVILTPPQGYAQGDMDFACPHSGEPITSAKKRREVMAKHNLVEAEPL